MKVFPFLMSFLEETTTHKIHQIEELYKNIIDVIIDSAKKPLDEVASVFSWDSRSKISVREAKYSHVITSAPYPNRISYIRELRPYMYWTKFLNTAREASEIDWKAIGGTWGIATSRLQDWSSNKVQSPKSLKTTVSKIEKSEGKNNMLIIFFPFL